MKGKHDSSGRRYAEDSLDLVFSAGMTLIQQKNTADLVLRPQRGGVRTAVTWDLRFVPVGMVIEKDVSNIGSVFGKHLRGGQVKFRPEKLATVCGDLFIGTPGSCNFALL